MSVLPHTIAPTGSQEGFFRLLPTVRAHEKLQSRKFPEMQWEGAIEEAFACACVRNPLLTALCSLHADLPGVPEIPKSLSACHGQTPQASLSVLQSTTRLAEPPEFGQSKVPLWPQVFPGDEAPCLDRSRHAGSAPLPDSGRPPEEPQPCTPPLRFFLGTHQPEWLCRTGVPLFVSRRRLAGRRTLPRATCSWALDSGGFSELTLHGRWTVSARQYVSEVRRFADEIGGLAWAAAQDWMCEQAMLTRTGLTVRRHQRLTVENYLDLVALAPDLPFVPVLQGWTEADYLGHVDQYAAAGVDVDRLPLVGLGSVCRRQHTSDAERIIRRLAGMGIRLHGFGFKSLGLGRVATVLASADSMAWSLRARYSTPLPGCHHSRCNNCLRFALHWRENLLNGLPRGTATPRV